MLAALKSGCQSDAEFWAAIAELRQSGAEQSVPSDSETSTAAPAPKKRGPKPLAERTPEQQAAHAAKMVAKKAGGSAEPKQQSGAVKAWIQLCSDTVKEMNGHGWAAWKDPKSGTMWSGSTLNAEGNYVFAEGVHAGKAASNQRGGMARASYIKSQVVGLQGAWAEMDVVIEGKDE